MRILYRLQKSASHSEPEVNKKRIYFRFFDELVDVMQECCSISHTQKGLGRVYLEWTSSMGEEFDMATEPIKLPVSTPVLFTSSVYNTTQHNTTQHNTNTKRELAREDMSLLPFSSRDVRCCSPWQQYSEFFGTGDLVWYIPEGGASSVTTEAACHTFMCDQKQEQYRSQYPGSNSSGWDSWQWCVHSRSYIAGNNEQVKMHAFVFHDFTMVLFCVWIRWRIFGLAWFRM
jgi:hypothetical protein